MMNWQKKFLKNKLVTINRVNYISKFVKNCHKGSKARIKSRINLMKVINLNQPKLN